MEIFIRYLTCKDPDSNERCLWGNLLTPAAYKAADTLFIEHFAQSFAPGKPISYAQFKSDWKPYIVQIGTLMQNLLENPPEEPSGFTQEKKVRAALLQQLNGITTDLIANVRLPACTPSFRNVIEEIVCPLLAPIWVPVRLWDEHSTTEYLTSFIDRGGSRSGMGRG